MATMNREQRQEYERLLDLHVRAETGRRIARMLEVAQAFEQLGIVPGHAAGDVGITPQWSAETIAPIEDALNSLTQHELAFAMSLGVDTESLFGRGELQRWALTTLADHMTVPWQKPWDYERDLPEEAA